MRDPSANPQFKENCSVRRYLGSPKDAASTDQATPGHDQSDLSSPEPAFSTREPPYVDRWRPEYEPSRAAFEQAYRAERLAAGHPLRPPEAVTPPFVFDLAFVLSAAWRYRAPIIAGAVICGLLGAAMTAMLARNFVSTAQIYFDPQKFAVQLVSDDKTMSSEVFSSTMNSQARIMTSNAVLADVANALSLQSDPEFLAASSGNPEADLNAVIGNLQSHIDVTRQDGTFIFQIKVKTSTPNKSADIANALVAAYLKDASANAELGYENANDGLVQRLGSLKEAVIAAEAAARDYRSSNDLYSVGGDLIADKRLQLLDESRLAAQNKSIAAKAQLDSVSKLDVNNVVVDDPASGNASSTLLELRTKYSNLSASLSSLTQTLGPRHPQLLAAQATMGDLKRQIQVELERMVAAAQSAYRAAQQEEADLNKEIVIQKASQVTNSGSVTELGELERKAKAARDIYEAVLTRSEETAAQRNLYESNVRVVSQAVPALAPDGPGRKKLFLAGAFGGGVLGLALGVLLAAALTVYRVTRKR